jgi:hypothetical protein
MKQSLGLIALILFVAVVTLVLAAKDHQRSHPLDQPKVSHR